MLYRYRYKLDSISNKIAKFFLSFHITANVCTFFGLISSIIFLFLFIEKNILSLLFLFLSGFFDMIDGAIARISGMENKKGAYIDTIVDRYSEFFIILALFFTEIEFFIDIKFLVFLLLFGSLMTTYTKSSSIEKKIRKNSICILCRPERMILLFISVISFFLFSYFFSYLILLLALLTNISAIIRFISFMK